MSNLFEIVRSIVHKDWNPIGVADLTGEFGEYDSYIPGLCELLRRNASESELFDYLWTVETQSIGLIGDRQATESFAKRLCELRQSQGS
ncbi:MAG: hypothetical protein V4719_22440 [Planctomycetota bacterium]